MFQKILFLFFLLIALNAQAANYYVRTDGSDSSCNGTADASGSSAPNCAWSHLQKAVDSGVIAGTGPHTIYIRSGTYGDSTGITPNDYILWNDLVNGMDLTVEGYATTPGDGHSADLGASRPVIATTGTTAAWYRTTAGNYDTGPLTIRNINWASTGITGSAATYYGNTSNVSPDANLLVQWSKFILPASYTGYGLMAHTVNAITSTRTLEFDDFEWVTTAGVTGALYYVQDFGLFKLKNGIVGNTNSHLVTLANEVGLIWIEEVTTGNLGQTFLSNPTAGVTLGGLVILNNTATMPNNWAIKMYDIEPTANSYVWIEGNTFTMNGAGFGLGLAYRDVYAGTTPWNNVVVRGNKFIRTGALDGHGMMIGLNVHGALIENNIVKSKASDYGIVDKGMGTSVLNNVVYGGGINIYKCGGTYGTIKGNSVYNTGTTEYPFFFGPNANPSNATVSSAVAATNGTATVTVTGANLSRVLVGNVAVIASRTDGIQGSNLFRITAFDDTADTLTVTPSPGTATNQQLYVYDEPRFVNVVDNIFQGGQYVMRNNFSTHQDFNFDRNILYGGTNGLAYLQGGTRASIAAIQALWGVGTWIDSNALNDRNSISADPLFVDPANGNLRVRSGSPARGIQLLSTNKLDLWSDLGAWQYNEKKQDNIWRWE